VPENRSTDAALSASEPENARERRAIAETQVWAHASTSGIHAPAYDEAVIVADDLEELVGGERRLVRLHQLVSTLALRKGKSLAG
jgi:hypothetical protein